VTRKPTRSPRPRAAFHAAEAGLVIAERRGRDRINYINPVPLREWYERWVQPLADTGSASLLALKRTAEESEHAMSG